MSTKKKVSKEEVRRRFSIRHTIQEFKDIAEGHGGKCLSPVFLSSKYKLTFQCKRGHIWLARSYQIIDGHWCQKCFHLDRVKYTIEDLHEYAEEHGGLCLSDEFKFSASKYHWLCGDCGFDWLGVWTSMHSYYSWCRRCAAIKAGLIFRGNPISTKREFNAKYRLRLFKNHNVNLNQLQAVPKSIDSKDACRIISCEPAQKLLKDILSKQSEIRIKLAKRETLNKKQLAEYIKLQELEERSQAIHNNLIKIQKIMYEKRNYSAKSVTVALAIFLTTTFTQIKSCDLCEITAVTIRSLMKKLGIKKQDKSEILYKPGIVL